MASASSPLPPPFLYGLQRPPLKSNSPVPFQIRRNPNLSPKRYPIVSAASSDPSSWEREEIRWLREEQRWLREEQRWLREESRWRSERESLLREIAVLRLKIEALEGRRSSSDSSAVDASIGSISDVGGRRALAEEAEVKEVILEEVAKVSDEGIFRGEREIKKEWKMLRKGSEGKEVRAMQEALLNLGFYSGEEDMEYSSFSSGTERAVKTWQASLGALEDGIMTSELLERLFMERTIEEYKKQGRDSIGDAVNGENVGTNGTPNAPVSKITEIREMVISETSEAEVEVSAHRVFLLGENRWEEPSRLTGRNKPVNGSKSVSTKCLTCRGEGRLMCTECDGSGEPNIEEQFMEWIEEGAKCPYCEGLGYTICDVCEGSTTTTQI